jgi:hypothetical protein
VLETGLKESIKNSLKERKALKSFRNNFTIGTSVGNEKYLGTKNIIGLG